MDNTKWKQSNVRKTSFFCTNALESCVPAQENTYQKHFFASFFIFDSTVSRKMDHFDISFACSIFSKSWEVTNYGFLGAAHLPGSPSDLTIWNYLLKILLDIIATSCRLTGRWATPRKPWFVTSWLLEIIELTNDTSKWSIFRETVESKIKNDGKKHDF